MTPQIRRMMVKNITNWWGQEEKQIRDGTMAINDDGTKKKKA